MCDLALGLMAASTGLSMFSQYQQGKAQAQSYKLQAEQAEQNRNFLQTKNSLEADNYAKKQKQLNDRLRLAIGNARAQAGGSGLSAENGSVVDIMDSSTDAFNADSANLLASQRHDSWANYVEQANETNKMNAYNQMAKNSRRQAGINMFGTLLGGAASMYGQYKNTHVSSGSKKDKLKAEVIYDSNYGL